jgi:hypothetical protein
VKNLASMDELVGSLNLSRNPDYKFLNSNLRDNEKVASYINSIKQAKNKEDIITVFNAAGIPDSKLLVDQISFQNQKLLEVYKAIPELKFVSVEDRKKIFTEVLNELYLLKKVNNQSPFVSNKKIQKFPVLKDMGCYDNFNLDWNGCTMNYNYEVMGIWSVVLATSLYGGEIAALPLLAGAFSLTSIAYLVRESCYSSSVAYFNICMN